MTEKNLKHCPKCKRDLPLYNFEINENTKKHRKYCISCRENNTAPEPLPPKYGTKTNQIRETQRQQLEVAENRLKSLSPIKDRNEFDKTIELINSLRVKV